MRNMTPKHVGEQDGSSKNSKCERTKLPTVVAPQSYQSVERIGHPTKSAGRSERHLSAVSTYPTENDAQTIKSSLTCGRIGAIVAIVQRGKVFVGIKEQTSSCIPRYKARRD